MQGKLEESIECFNKAITISPNEYPGWNCKGVSLRKLGNLEEYLKKYPSDIRKEKSIQILEESIECYDKALELSEKAFDLADKNGAMGLWAKIGVLIGIGIGELVSWLARESLGSELLQAQFGVSLIVGALLFSFIIGMLSGFFPALAASRKQPVEALRYE